MNDRSHRRETWKQFSWMEKQAGVFSRILAISSKGGQKKSTTVLLKQMLFLKDNNFKRFQEDFGQPLWTKWKTLLSSRGTSQGLCRWKLIFLFLKSRCIEHSNIQTASLCKLLAPLQSRSGVCLTSSAPSLLSISSGVGAKCTNEAGQKLVAILTLLVLSLLKLVKWEKKGWRMLSHQIVRKLNSVTGRALHASTFYLFKPKSWKQHRGVRV